MSEQIKVRKLLVLHGPSLESQGVLELLQQHFQVQVAQRMDEALDAMRKAPFDAVLAETADFLPLERGVVTQQAAVLLDTIADGVGIFGSQGQLIWGNRRLRDFPDALMARLQEVCAQAFAQLATEGPSDCSRGRRYSLLPDDGSYFEIICTPVRDHVGALQQVAAVMVNATSQRRQQIKLNAIDKAGRELVSLDAETLAGQDATQRLKLLEDRVIGCSLNVLQYKHFAVLLLNERSNRLESIICEGMDGSQAAPELFASTEGNGICGYVAASGQCYVCRDVQSDPRYIPSMANARSTLTVPLRLHDKVIGVLNVESDRVGAFGEEDRQFAVIFANYVALALQILNLLVVERHSTHTQVSGSFSAELAGPLNDIITCANEIIEDYIGHDDLRKRMGSIVDTAMEARRVLQQLVDAPKTGILGSTHCTCTKKDPVLGGKRILVADDEELIRQTICDVLAQQGCDVENVADGKAAIEKLAHARYDLVISDIKMPGATGYEVFAAAKAADPATEIILITAFGYDPHHSIVKANREGLSAVLMKPFKVKQLLDECRAALM